MGERLAANTTKALGRHGLRTAAVSLGCAPIGNLDDAMDDSQAHATVEAAWESGHRYFDTAPHYGLGLSERRLGQALAGYAREEYVLSTKVGRLLVDAGTPAPDDEGFAVTSSLRRRRDYSRDGVLRSLEGSLKRLGTDAVDIVLVHDPDEHLVTVLDETFPALEDLRRQGVIRSYGAGMNQAPMLGTFLEHTDADVLMCAGRYTLLDRSGRSLMDRAHRSGVSIVAAGVFNSGLLALEEPAPEATFDYRTAPRPLLHRARQLARLCAEHGTTLPAAAAQFPLRHPAVATVCLGARSADQVRRNAGLLSATVPDQLWEAVDDLVAHDRPVPHEY